MVIDLVFITHNRLPYTKLSLASILADPTEEFALTIWDNASTDGTAEYLRDEVSDPRIADIVFSKENAGQTAAINTVWSNSKADLLGKLDNDCIVTPGWTRTLAKAHQDIAELGVVAMWHFFPDEFDYARAKHKIQQFGRHQIFRHPWTCGTGLLIKRDAFLRLGPIRERTTTKYWIQMALAGYVNGFYYPLIYQEHMDDIRSEHNSLWTQNASFADTYKYSPGFTSGATANRTDYDYWHQKILDELLDGPWEVKAYVGYRRKLLRVIRKLTEFRNRRVPVKSEA